MPCCGCTVIESSTHFDKSYSLCSSAICQTLKTLLLHHFTGRKCPSYIMQTFWLLSTIFRLVRNRQIFRTFIFVHIPHSALFLHVTCHVTCHAENYVGFREFNRTVFFSLAVQLAILLGYAILLAGLGAILPGKTKQGASLADGTKITYKCNGE